MSRLFRRASGSWDYLALLTASLVAMIALAPVCAQGVPALKQPQVVSRVKGMGINVHGELLPVDKLKAIGVKWVRAYYPQAQFNRDKVQRLANHYRDFGILFILFQDHRDVQASARILVDAGIKDIEVYNEPKLANISPEKYVQDFNKVKQAVGSRALLYGPSLSNWKWEQDYLEKCLRLGMKPDVISFHGYDGQPGVNAANLRSAKQYGYPTIISEMGYPTHLGPNAYKAAFPVQKKVSQLFLETKRLLEGETWCWYDGPNPAFNKGTGLFDFDGTQHTIPNATYWEIVRALQS